MHNEAESNAVAFGIFFDWLARSVGTAPHCIHAVAGELNRLSSGFASPPDADLTPEGWPDYLDDEFTAAKARVLAQAFIRRLLPDP